MDNNPISSLIDLLAVSGHSRVDLERVIFQNCGHIIIPVEFLGFVGGNITEMSTDEHGRIRYRNFVVSPLLSCGHVTTSIGEISGTCFVCKRLICDQCLLNCDLTGVPICKKHSTIKDGVVIGNHARKGLWRLKVRKISQEKELGYYERKQIPYK
jgi:hypothetical protein